jgi:hypothetical protein
MKYKLMVSYDCGISYSTEAKADTVDELVKKAVELKLDENWLRWVIEDENEKIQEIGAIHKGILDALRRLNEKKT